MKATLALLKGILTKMGTSLKDIPADAPAEVKAALTASRDNILTLLGKMPAETEDAAAMESKLLTVLNGVQDVAGDAITQLAKLPLLVKSGVDAAVTAKIAAGELLTPEKAQNLVAAARAEEKQTVEKATKEHLILMGTRRTELQTAELPEMPEGLLAGKPEEFNAAKTKAATRKTELTEKKLLALLGTGEQADLLYASDDVYNKHRDTLLKVMNGGKSAPDGMRGGGAGNGGGTGGETLAGPV